MPEPEQETLEEYIERNLKYVKRDEKPLRSDKKAFRHDKESLKRDEEPIWIDEDKDERSVTKAISESILFFLICVVIFVFVIGAVVIINTAHVYR